MTRFYSNNDPAAKIKTKLKYGQLVSFSKSCRKGWLQETIKRKTHSMLKAFSFVDNKQKQLHSIKTCVIINSTQVQLMNKTKSATLLWKVSEST